MAEVADDTVHPLACSLLPAERALVARYLLNALSLPERRSIRAELLILISTLQPLCSYLLRGAGWYFRRPR